MGIMTSANGLEAQTSSLNLPGKQVGFDEKAYVYMSNESARFIYEVLSGRVKIVIKEGKKEIIKKIARPGDVIGLCGLGKTREYCEEAMALTKTKLIKYHVSTIEDADKKDPKLSFTINQFLIDEIHAMDQRIRSMAFENARERVVNCLLHLVEKEGERLGYEYLIRNALTHQEMAGLTATSRQTVTSVLNELKEQGLIKFNRQRILINDLSSLEKHG
jgi:CRP-like cAMP-binding protein